MWEEEEALQAEAEARLAVEQANRAEEDARLRELYPLPEDEEDQGYDADVTGEEELGGVEPAEAEGSDPEASEAPEGSSDDGSSEDPAR